MRRESSGERTQLKSKDRNPTKANPIKAVLESASEPAELEVALAPSVTQQENLMVSNVYR